MGFNSGFKGLTFSCLSVCLVTHNNTPPTGRIFAKILILRTSTESCKRESKFG